MHANRITGGISGLVVAFIFATAAAAASFEVGHTYQTFVDANRDGRQVPTEIYYPADVAGDDVPVADPGEGGFPLLSMGHGFLMPWSAYGYLWTSLVPEGYVVMVPRTEGGLFPSHLEFGRDLAFAIQALRELAQQPSTPFFGKLANASAVMGHSMGGGSSFLAAQHDPSISAVVGLAPAETSPSAIQAASGLAMPLLIIGGTDDCVTPPAQHQIPMYDNSGSECKTLILLSGGSHCQFADYNFTCSLGETGCPSPGLSRDEQHALIHQFLLPWLDAFLKASHPARVEFQDLLSNSPAITYQQYCPVSLRREQSGLEFDDPLMQ